MFDGISAKRGEDKFGDYMQDGLSGLALILIGPFLLVGAVVLFPFWLLVRVCRAHNLMGK